MLFKQSIIGNSRTGAEQWKEVRSSRDMANNHNQFLANAAGLHANAGLIPQDVYQEFDTVTVEAFSSDDGDTFINDLLPLSKSVSIGKLVSKFRQASEAGNAQTSMSGQTGLKMDQVDFKYDGAIVPVHDTGFFRNWREWNAMTSEGYDGLIDDQRESVKSIRRHLADNILDGHVDRDGNFINVDGISWQGMRNDTRVAQVELGATGVNFDFTLTTNTAAQIKAAFIEVRNVLWITNKCQEDATYYVSREIASNFERKFSTSYDSKIIMQELADLMGVATIKVSSKLSGNEFMAFPLSMNAVRPVVGMALNTVALPRQAYNADYKFSVWGAIGIQVRTDYDGNTCALMAHVIA